MNNQSMSELTKMFMEEALTFLKVNINEFPQFKTSIEFDASNKIICNPYIDYENRIVHWPYIIERILPGSQDKPTFFRENGYILARRWHQFLVNELKTFGLPTGDELLFKESLCILKGVYNNTPIERALINTKIISTKNNIDFLRNKFNINCEYKQFTHRYTKEYFIPVRLTKEAQRKELQKLNNLSNHSYNTKIKRIREGDPGSKSNPMLNVDEAANWILNMEHDELANNPYRQYIRNEQYFFDPIHQCFRISWASANVSYYDGPTVISDGFVVNQLDSTKSNRFSIKPCLKDRLFLFRGQSESWYPECVPGKWRKNKDGEISDTIISELITLELELLITDYPLVKLLESGLTLFHEKFNFAINYEGLSQHYGNKTEYLDLTSQMEVAKFFAVTTYNSMKDEYEPFHGNDIGVLYYYRLEPDSFIKLNGRKHQLSTIGRQPFMRSGNQYGFLLELEQGQDFNKLEEVGAVYFKHDKTITNRIFQESQNGDKYKPTELLGIKWFQRIKMKEISNRVVKEYCKRTRLSRSKVVKSVRKAGYKISSNNFKFDKADLDLYYHNSRIHWKEFCENVYFYSPEGRILKRYMESVPDMPEYQWAFIK